MAPQKTMVISQQQQQQQPQAVAKPRKRKAKQQQQQQQPAPSQLQSGRIAEQQQVKSAPVKIVPVTNTVQENISPAKVAAAAAVGVANNKNNNNKQTTIGVATETEQAVASERTSISKKQQQVPSTLLVNEPIVDNRKSRSALTELSPASVISKHQQLAGEEADDVDAGIELDGSSNSGSSVKDISEDQLKSTSASPIMAQGGGGSLINGSGGCNGMAKQLATPVVVAAAEQLTTTTGSSLCTPAGSVKKLSSTKQQLAANQQVIDADEQLLQEKLQNKQRQLSLKQEDSNSNSSSTPAANDANQAGDKSQQNGATRSSDKNGRVRRSFSSQSSQEEGSLCKVCDQHVYQMERMLAEKSIYHKRCFRCYQCKIQLRVDSYSSHKGQVYCKAHHRQLFQPQVKLDAEEDVDIVAKSRILKRQMIICENEPAELPKDVVRSDTKPDDGINQLNLNLNNLLEKFERGQASIDEESQASPTTGVLIDKPSFNIKQTLMAFESRLVNPTGEDDSSDAKRAERITERPVVKKLTNLQGFLKSQNSEDNSTIVPKPVRPLAVKRSESLMMRLKKYESRIAGEQVDDDDDESSDNEEENDNKNKKNNEDSTSDVHSEEGEDSSNSNRRPKGRGAKPKRLTTINLSSLKNQWETGDINKREEEELNSNAAGDNNCVGGSPSVEKNEELCRIREQLAQKKLGESGSVRNIYEKAIREAQIQQKQRASDRRDSSDLSALNGFSTSEIQQQLLQQTTGNNNNNNNTNQSNGSTPSVQTPVTPNKEHFQLNFNNKANKLKEKFELGLITNSSRDDSDQDESDDSPAMTKLEQIRQEKLEDLSVFTEGEIKAREARSLFQQIDRRISAANGGSGKAKLVTRPSLASIGDSMRAKLTNQMNNNNNATNGASSSTTQNQSQEANRQQPIRLKNNVRA